MLAIRVQPVKIAYGLSYKKKFIGKAHLHFSAVSHSLFLIAIVDKRIKRAMLQGKHEIRFYLSFSIS